MIFIVINANVRNSNDPTIINGYLILGKILVMDIIWLVNVWI